jgi:hypothetical protein
MSTFRVIGQIKYSNENEFDSYTESFTDFVEASNYYNKLFTDVASDMSEIGGEFVITLLKDSADEQQIEVIRRQVLSTTKHDSSSLN